MPHGTRNWLILGVLTLPLVFAGPVFAQSPPSLTRLTASDSLSSQDKAQIDAFVSYWTDVLATDDFDEADRAADKLYEPLNSPGVSAIFRAEYSRSVLNSIETCLESDSPFRSSNAIVIVGHLGSESALNLLLRHLNVLNEPRFAIRLKAAEGVGKVLKTQSLNAAAINSASRDLSQAAANETNARVLRRQFEALSAATKATQSLLPPPAPDNNRVLRDRAQALDAVVDKISMSDGPSELMVAIRPTVTDMRNDYLQMDGATQKQFGKLLNPALGRVYDVASKHWDEAQANGAREVYAAAIGPTEQFMKIITRSVSSSSPTPSENMIDAWEQGDKAKFNRGVEQWNNITSKPPFGR